MSSFAFQSRFFFTTKNRPREHLCLNYDKFPHAIFQAFYLHAIEASFSSLSFTELSSYNLIIISFAYII